MKDGSINLKTAVSSYENAECESRLSALAMEMTRRIPAIKGYAVLIKQWVDSQPASEVPEVVHRGLDEIIEDCEALVRVCHIMTKRPE